VKVVDSRPTSGPRSRDLGPVVWRHVEPSWGGGGLRTHELHLRRDRRGRQVANPGSTPMRAARPGAPAAEGLIEGRGDHAKSGVRKRARVQRRRWRPSRDRTTRPYKVTGHRTDPESPRSWTELGGWQTVPTANRMQASMDLHPPHDAIRPGASWSAIRAHVRARDARQAIWRLRRALRRTSRFVELPRTGPGVSEVARRTSSGSMSRSTSSAERSFASIDNSEGAARRRSRTQPDARTA